MPVVPTIVLITGSPCTGKSTLGATIAGRLGWPVLAKDTIKEALLDTLGQGDRAWSRRLSDASYAVMFRLAAEQLQAGNSLVLEGNFRVGEHERPLEALLGSVRARLVQVVLHAEPEALRHRLLERARSGSRHPGHRDMDLVDALREQIPTGTAQPLALAGDCLCFDTTRLDAALLERLSAEVVRAAAPQQ